MRYTNQKGFRDLEKFDLEIKNNETYMFDMFIFPEFRNNDTSKRVTETIFKHFRGLKIKKFYGFYFADNVGALWWHRAVLRANEIKEVRVNRLLFVEFVC